MADLQTYRQEMTNMSPTMEKKEMVVSNFISTMYRFMNWLTMTCNRQSGYLNHMAKDSNPMLAIDVMQVMSNIIDV